MDINQLVIDSIDTTVKNIAEGKFETEFIFDDSELLALSKQNKMLMHFSVQLLTNYHEELRKSLADQGINI